jgi:hypothetical protein
MESMEDVLHHLASQHSHTGSQYDSVDEVPPAHDEDQPSQEVQPSSDKEQVQEQSQEQQQFQDFQSTDSSVEESTPKPKTKGRPRTVKSYQRAKQNFDSKQTICDYLIGNASFNQNRGRPRNLNSTEYDDLVAHLKEKLFDDIEILLSDPEKRTDAKLTSFSRKVKKIPLTLLHYYCSKTQFKSASIEATLISYIEFFKMCFEVVFPQVGVYQLQNIFLDVITLHFSECRVLAILKKLVSDGVITQDQMKVYESKLKLSKATSKKKVKDLYENNLAFECMINSMPRFFDDSSAKVKESLAKVLSKIKN